MSLVESCEKVCPRAATSGVTTKPNQWRGAIKPVTYYDNTSIANTVAAPSVLLTHTTNDVISDEDRRLLMTLSQSSSANLAE